MKYFKIFLLSTVFFFTCFIAHGQLPNYTPFPESDAVWVGTRANGDNSTGCVVFNDYNQFIKGDTTINGVIYHKVYKNIRQHWTCGSEENFTDNEYSGAFRNDVAEKKVYYLNNGEEKLAYDFNISVGDTLSKNHIIIYDNTIVYNIDSVEVQSVYRNRYHLKVNNSFFAFIVEGIGNSSGGAFTPIYERAETWYEFYCHRLNGEPAWSDFPQNSDCSMLSIQDNLPAIQSQVKIYPNPTKDGITIESENKIDKIQVYDMLGNLLLLSENEIRINLKHLQRGNYLILVTDVSGKRMVESVVLN